MPDTSPLNVTTKLAVSPSCTLDLSSDSSSGVWSSSSTSTGPTDTVSMPESSIVVVFVAVAFTVTGRVAVAADVSFSTTLSPGSSTWSVNVPIVIVPLLWPAAIVSFPLGAV